MKYYIIDRFEGNLAVCESDDGSFIHLPRFVLPTEIGEGSVIRETDSGDFFHDVEFENELRKKIIELQKQVFGDE